MHHLPRLRGVQGVCALGVNAVAMDCGRRLSGAAPPSVKGSDMILRVCGAVEGMAWP